MTAEHALERMVELFDEGRWLNRHNAYLKEGYCAVRADGTPTMHYDELAVGYCMGGAMAKVTGQPLCATAELSRLRAREVAASSHGHSSPCTARCSPASNASPAPIYGWYNDAPGRTYEEVRALLVEARELGVVDREV